MLPTPAGTRSLGETQRSHLMFVTNKAATVTPDTRNKLHTGYLKLTKENCLEQTREIIHIVFRVFPPMLEGKGIFHIPLSAKSDGSQAENTSSVWDSQARAAVSPSSGSGTAGTPAALGNRSHSKHITPPSDPREFLISFHSQHHQHKINKINQAGLNSVQHPQQPPEPTQIITQRPELAPRWHPGGQQRAQLPEPWARGAAPAGCCRLCSSSTEG